MKKLLIVFLVAVTSMILLDGCIGLTIGGGSTTKAESATLGQQLLDLQRARDKGAISQAEYQTQKMKLLGK